MIIKKDDVSLIVPAYNAADNIIQLLNSLYCQNYSGQFEIIIVDDNSNDNTLIKVNKFSKKSKIKLKVYSSDKNLGPSKARNIGIEKSSGSIVVFIDSDCIANKDWLKQLVNSLRSNDVVAVGGRVLLDKSLENNIISRYCMISFIPVMSDRGIVKYTINKNNFVNLYSNNLCFYKSVIAECGNFPVEYTSPAGEEVELNLRVCLKGYNMLYNPLAIVHHKHRSTIKKLVDQQINYGIGFYMNFSRNKMPVKMCLPLYSITFYLILNIIILFASGLSFIILLNFTVIFSLLLFYIIRTRSITDSIYFTILDFVRWSSWYYGYLYALLFRHKR